MTAIVLEVAKALCSDDGREWYSLSGEAMARYVEAARALIFLDAKPTKPLPLDE